MLWSKNHGGQQQKENIDSSTKFISALFLNNKHYQTQSHYKKEKNVCHNVPAL